jgi:apolipoprotein N-acyltransferase
LPTGAKIDENSTIKVALIQGGVSQLGFDFNSNPKEVFNRHLEQTKATIVKSESDLIVWPENSVDVDLKKYPDVSQTITDLSRELNIPILVGEVASTADQQFLLNQSILFSPNQSAKYTKRYLTPFGEFIPLRNLTGRFSKYSDNVIDFKPGIGEKVFSVNGISFNVKICYELLSDGQNREISDFSVVQTNNATFGYTKQLEQQLVIAKIRAIESGRYFAYVSTTGITSIIDNNGKLVENLPKFKPGTLNFEIPTANGKTINQRLGGWLEPLIFLLMLGAALRGKIKSRFRNGLTK